MLDFSLTRTELSYQKNLKFDLKSSSSLEISAFVQLTSGDEVSWSCYFGESNKFCADSLEAKRYKPYNTVF
jgi:hypothetical protein